ncbi:244_t:CDS:1, partial [Diversispora eburnea]
ATSWDNLEITSFNLNSIKTSPDIIVEYERLIEKYNNIIGRFNTFVI